MDEAGLSTSGRCTITVLNDAPVMVCPADMEQECTGEGMATVDFVVTVTDAQEGDLTSRVTCSPASGSSFALGSHTVDCSVTDSNGAASSCSFAVTVVDGERSKPMQRRCECPSLSVPDELGPTQ